MRRIWIILTLALAGCVTQSPIIPSRYQIGIQSARAAVDQKSVVLIGDSAESKSLKDGNSYVISWMSTTNVTSTATNDPLVIAAKADLATNTWPSYRIHLDLSVDGGLTWTSRIGYGLQTPGGAFASEFTWSPPNDYSLLTTQAVLRAVNLDGSPFTGVRHGRPWDINPTNGLRSSAFAIVGSVIDLPAAGAVIYPDTPGQLQWRQVGGGPTAIMYWLTPTSSGIDDGHIVTTLSNIVDGVNSLSLQWPANLPAAAQMKFCIRSVTRPVIIGYSGVFTVSP